MSEKDIVTDLLEQCAAYHGTCATCKDPVPLRGLFTCQDSTVPAPMCSHCLLLNWLKAAECYLCAGRLVVGLVAIQTTAGRVVPMPVCPVCLSVHLDGSESEVIVDKDRTLITDESGNSPM